MISFIIHAAENFCLHQIGSPHTVQPLPSKMRTLIAYLDIKGKNSQEYRVYIGCDDVLIQFITEIFLGEALSDRETLHDMLLETANMIVGSAKVLAQEQSTHSFTIATPHLYEENSFAPETDKYYTLSIAEGEMTIAIKAL